MKLKAFAIFDDKAKTFNHPFFSPNEAIAVRVFSDASRDTDTIIGKHPSDFRLYRIGEFDQTSGKITSEEVPEFCCNAVDTLEE